MLNCYTKTGKCKYQKVNVKTELTNIPSKYITKYLPNDFFFVI